MLVLCLVFALLAIGLSVVAFTLALATWLAIPDSPEPTLHAAKPVTDPNGPSGHAFHGHGHHLREKS